MFKIRFLFMLLVAAQISYGQNQAEPIDGLFAETGLENRRLLPYPSIRAADVSWQKKQTRVVDTRELINLPFRHPVLGLFQAIEAGVRSGELTVYDPAFPDFSQALDGQAWLDELNRVDTVRVTHPTTGEVSWEVVRDIFDPEVVVRYRIREIVYFDRQSSTQRTRIIGIAPLMQTTDERGQPSFEFVMGWIYWPHARSWFDQHGYYLEGTDQAVMSWADALDMRRFNSYIMERSNVKGDRLSNHYQGRALLLESQNLEAEQVNREHDMWSY
ncbi:MAG: gliding motility protein GldN [Bacteroidota bacterium]